MQTASSSTSSSCRWKYDVFLSFRGEDTRKGFIDHLYTAFIQKGLSVFKDDKELKSGKLFPPELNHAIEESRSALVVLSRNYASSTWCLNELVQIVQCKNIEVFPLFYYVEPSVVRNQKEEFKEAFDNHDKTFKEDIEKVRTWRDALKKVTAYKGYHLKDQYESQFIQDILKEISSKLCFSKYTSVEGLVGIDSRLEKLKKFMSPESHDVRMIGICGMGGLGKTTIARVAYELFHDEFDGSSFLANVREISEKGGLVSLQKTLLSDMKIDDINVYNEFDGIRMIRSRLGQQIVKRECPEEPGKRNRLWMEADIRHVLTENTGTEVLEGIILNFSKEEIHCCAKVFSKMINLRLLKIRNVQLPEGLDYLPNNLRLLDWEGYPLKSLPPNLNLDKIIELKMDQSHIQQLQQGIKPFNNLESISFRECEYLIKTPDFTFAPNLKHVDLYSCTMLREIHPSLLVHKKITHLNMTFCTSLTTLPNQIHMESLEDLALICCHKLEKFPEIVGSMDCLRSLTLYETAIKELPMSIELLSGLECFGLLNCKNLVRIPVTIKGLKSLREFTLRGCSKLDNLPETLGQVEKLKILNVTGTAIRQPMASIFLMKNLEWLSFSGCKGPPSNSLSSLFLKTTFRLPTLSGFCRSLERLIMRDCNLEEDAIPNDFFGSFSSLLRLDLSKNNFVSLPGSIKHLSKLNYLCLNDCKRLRSLPELPSNTRYINVNGCVALETTSNALRLCNPMLLDFSCVNCLKLICCNNLASSMLREYLKGISKPIDRPQRIYKFGMVIPGSEIPEWFQHQSETSSIKIERPPDSFDNKMVGYAVCCVFDIHEHQPILRKGYYMGTHGISCRVNNIHPLEKSRIHFEENSGKAMSNHLWLFYFLADELNQDFVQLSFAPYGPGSEVKKCGIHPVYKKEIEELKPRAKKSSSSSFGNSYELDEDFLESTADVDSDGVYFSTDDEPVTSAT